MANRCPKARQKSSYLTGRRGTAKPQRTVWLFLCWVLLTVFLVTTGVPVLAKLPITVGLAPNPTVDFLEQNQEEIAQSLTVPDAQLVHQGRQLYETGQFLEAALLWKQAEQAYQKQGAVLNQANTLNYLSLAYQALGQWEQAKDAIAKSLNLLQGSEKLEARRIAIFAQALNNQGRLQLSTGQAQAALLSWKQAEAAYERADNETGKFGSRINQAQALQTLGQYRQAKTLLEQIVKDLQSQPDSIIKARGLRSLGIALQTIGDLVQSKEILEQSRAISQKLNASNDTSATLLSIGNIARGLEKYNIAFAYYQEAAKKTNDATLRVQSQLNQLSLLVATKQWRLAQDLAEQIESNLSSLPPSRTSVYARVNLAESLMKIGTIESKTSKIVGADLATNSNNKPISLLQNIPVHKSKIVGAGLGTNSNNKPISILQNPPLHKSKIKSQNTNLQNIAQLLATAIQQARQLGDPRAEAYSLYQLGKLYEQTQQWDNAKQLTEQALQIAQTIEAADITARSAWQLGRILKQQGNTTGAIAAYESAVDHLKSLRSDLVAINPDVQFTFKESVEPVYRELVSLLLQPPSQAGNKGEVTQANLKLARELIEALQLAELDNFFRDACLDTKPLQIDEIDVQAAVIYPIILSDSLPYGNAYGEGDSYASRLEVILSLPHQPLRHYTTQLPSNEVEDILQKLHVSLYPGYSSEERLRLSKQVYDWLIRPAETDLANSKIATLVFVPDGFLRNLPMAALYDGKQYLVEKYSIALSPGLQLFPQQLQRQKLSALVVGLTEPRQGFSALPGVGVEVKQIAAKVDSQVFLNGKFTRTTLQNEINTKSFPIIHLATHGQFSSNPKHTFLLTWDSRVDVKDIDTFFQPRRLGLVNPIELLVLSACQTASGDKRATLGLAGLALRSGAYSTLASLWSVNDKSTADLMSEFYRQLTQSERPISKAEALRQAQLTLLNNPIHKHPFYWSAFVLIGNWL